jgi:hypothetical protein
MFRMKITAVAFFTAILYASPASAASVECTSSSSHPICVASYAGKPAGSLETGKKHTGIATIDGKKVKYACVGGTRSTPRKCVY